MQPYVQVSAHGKTCRGADQMANTRGFACRFAV